MIVKLFVQHREAASTLVDLGGVEFLSQLRLHCDESLHSLIDEVLEQLLQQPFTNPPPPVAAGQLPSVEVAPDGGRGGGGGGNYVCPLNLYFMTCYICV